MVYNHSINEYLDYNDTSKTLGYITDKQFVFSGINPSLDDHYALHGDIWKQLNGNSNASDNKLQETYGKLSWFASDRSRKDIFFNYSPEKLSLVTLVGIRHFFEELIRHPEIKIHFGIYYRDCEKFLSIDEVNQLKTLRCDFDLALKVYYFYASHNLIINPVNEEIIGTPYNKEEIKEAIWEHFNNTLVLIKNVDDLKTVINNVYELSSIEYYKDMILELFPSALNLKKADIDLLNNNDFEYYSKCKNLDMTINKIKKRDLFKVVEVIKKEHGFTR